jgi:hypothetical protein
VQLTKGERMRHVVIGLYAAVLLPGCGMEGGRKDLLQTYETKRLYHKQLLKTEKLQLYRKGHTVLILTAVYLAAPEELQHKKEDERFLVGIYIEGEGEPTEEMLLRSLSLDGVKPVSITPVGLDEVRRQEISFVTSWNRYYLVRFPYTEKKRFTLQFQNSMYGTGSLSFAKRAKYTFVKKVF